MMRQRFLLCLALVSIVSFPMPDLHAQGKLILPTENDAVFQGDGAEFYMHVNRTFEGETSRPWQAGQYGFVRNPRRQGGALIYTRFHEGIDIRPVRRDPSGVPLDPVRAIDDGKVVHVNGTAGLSNYGIYVVVEHLWGGSPFYSLYAHLRTVSVRAGERVSQGDELGIVGWTGSGLNRERAHLHFEINVLMTTHFEEWAGHYMASSPNRHGIYNGLNLFGIDVGDFYLQKREKPSLTVAQFLAETEAFFRVLVPASPNFQLVQRYPWLAGARAGEQPPSWEIHFTAAGVPVRAEPSEVSVPKARLSGIRTATAYYPQLTRGLVAGSSGSARLSESGQRTMHLLTFPD